MTAIRKSLINLARRVGTWLIRRFARWVATRVITYMENRIADWLERPKASQPRGRIRRWTRAVAWLRAHLPAVKRCAAKEFDSLADELERKGMAVAA